MGEAFMRSFDPRLNVFSAGTKPASKVNPFAVKVMSEIGIDISSHYPKDVEDFISQSFDYVITVCDNAKETCPVFVGKVNHRVHIGFEDPADATGTDEEITSVFRKVRDEIKRDFFDFYIKNIKDKL